MGCSGDRDSAQYRAAVSPRPLSAEERAALLALLNQANFDGRDNLLAQVESLQVVGRCTCGCATVDLAVPSAPPSESVALPIPNEAVVLCEDGEAIGGVLVFATDGFLTQLEVYDNGGGPISPFPPVERLRLEGGTR
jgi:hypothetical protein